MARATARPLTPTVIATAALLASLIVDSSIARADEPPPPPATYRMDLRKGDTDISTTITGGPNGFDVQISARQQAPGGDRDSDRRHDAPAAEAGAAPEQPRRGTIPIGVYGLAPSGSSGTVAAPPRAPVWTDEPPLDRPADLPRITVIPIAGTLVGPGGDGQAVGLTPEFIGYQTYVDGELQGTTWQALPPGPALAPQIVPPLPGEVRPGGGGGLDPYGVAIDILAHIPLPDMTLRMSPTLGLVALPSWYWAEGYDGSEFGQSRTIVIPPNPLDPDDRGRSFTVTVRVRGSRYDWSFGDGFGQTTGSLGRRYPAESDIRHTYEHSSLPYAGGFPIRMTAEFAAEFSVDGGAPQGLPLVRRSYETTFRVQEIQPVLLRAG